MIKEIKAERTNSYFIALEDMLAFIDAGHNFDTDNFATLRDESIKSFRARMLSIREDQKRMFDYCRKGNPTVNRIRNSKVKGD